MKSGISKNDLFEFLKKQMDEQDYSSVVEAVNKYLCNVEDNELEEKYCHYVYCLCTVCHDKSRLLDCMGALYPEEVLSRSTPLVMTPNEFKDFIYKHPCLSKAESDFIMASTDAVLIQFPSSQYPYFYRDFFILLYQCSFNPEVFAKNIQSITLNKQKRGEYSNDLVNDLKGLPVYVELKQIKEEIFDKLNIYLQNTQIKNNDAYKYEDIWNQWKKIDFAKIDLNIFSSQIACLVLDAFPENSVEEYRDRLEKDRQLNKDYESIIKLYGNNKIREIKFKTRSGSALNIDNPELVKLVVDVVSKEISSLRGLSKDKEPEYKEASVQRDILKKKIIRRLALLFYSYGLYEKSDRVKEHMKVINLAGQTEFISFGAKYGGYIFDIVNMVSKLDFFFEGIDCPQNGKAKWDAIKHNFNVSDDPEFTLNDLSDLRHNLSLYNKYYR